MVTIPIATGPLQVMIAAAVRKPTTAASFGVVAEMPLVLTLAACAGLVTSQLLTKVRPYVIFGIFVLAAIITPPDVVSQLLLALPMIGLYEAGLLFIRHILRK